MRSRGCLRDMGLKSNNCMHSTILPSDPTSMNAFMHHRASAPELVPICSHQHSGLGSPISSTGDLHLEACSAQLLPDGAHSIRVLNSAFASLLRAVMCRRGRLPCCDWVFFSAILLLPGTLDIPTTCCSRHPSVMKSRMSSEILAPKTSTAPPSGSHCTSP